MLPCGVREVNKKGMFNLSSGLVVLRLSHSDNRKFIKSSRLSTATLSSQVCIHGIVM